MAKKLFYKIGEACKKVDVQPYVLRYWETEFELLSPDKSKSGQRVYTEEDLAIIRRIKELLYDEGYTTVGAKKKLQAELAEGDGKLDSKTSDESGSKRSSSKKASSKKTSSKKTPSKKASAEKAPAEKPSSSKGSSKKDAGKTDSGKKNAEAGDDSGDAKSGSASEKRVAHLEAGLRQALEQAREILQRID